MRNYIQTFFIYWPAIVMGLAAFMATFDVTAVSLALPLISDTLNLEVNKSIWIMNSYGLAFTVFLIGAGAVSDRYGNRLALVTGTVLFLIASVLCAVSGSFAAMITGRVLQGFAAAFIVCGGYALMSHLYQEKADRVKAFAIMGVISGSALAIGPGLGGVIASKFGWTWVFLINIPVCVAIVAGALLGMSERKGETKQRIDLSGIVTFGAFLLIASWSMLNGPNVAGINFGIFPVCLVLIGLFVIFVLIERSSPWPAVQLSIFRNQTFNGLALVPLCLAISYWSLIVYIPIYLEAVFQIKTEQIAYLMLAFTLPMFLVPYFVTNLATRWSDQKFYSLGLVVVAVGCLIIALGAHFADYVLSIIGMVFAGVGAAAMQTQVSGALIASVPQEQAGAVSAIMTILRQGGFALGTALLSLTLAINKGPLDRYTVLFLVCASIAAVGAILAFILIRTDEKT